MMVDGKWLDNITCKKCRMRHPAEVTCVRAALIAAESAAERGTLFDMSLKMAEPIDMVLHCPACGNQHIDAPETEPGLPSICVWENPPHRSHLCHFCGHVWRPADVPTNGVAAVKTHGKNDSEIT